MSTHSTPDDGLVTVPSAHNAAETARRLEAVLEQKGLEVFARIDHAAAAHAAGMELRPTLLLLFGSPKAGTPLMQSNHTIGIDLPLKALVWEDADGQARLTYNRPAYLAARHGVHNRDDTVKAMAAGLDALARAATNA
jgi:uncharacterized protein (DUF302 family)